MFVCVWLYVCVIWNKTKLFQKKKTNLEYKVDLFHYWNSIIRMNCLSKNEFF